MTRLLSFPFARRTASLQLPVFMLIALLQRTPVLRLLATAESVWVSSSLGQVLKASAVVASMLGAVDTLAGATALVISPESPADATVGVAFQAAFFVSGNTTTESYSITNLPPGLSVPGSSPIAGGGRALINSIGTITGTPTQAGDWIVTIAAFDNANRTGDSLTTFYMISVEAGSSAPAITSQPADLTVTAGQSASFSVAATGSPAPTYQWRKGGININGATNTTFTINPTVTGDAGTYTVFVSNGVGSGVTSNGATLTVNAAPVAPSIVTQPANQTVMVGQQASFSVEATGTAPLTYQWRKTGQNINGATNATYTIASTVTGDAGTYSVVVTNSVSSVTSNGATLTVNPANTAPAITTQPVSQTVTAGNSVTFTVGASGTPTPTYQWQKGGVAISGATNSSYTIASPVVGDAGNYTVVVTNIINSVTSNAATLTVNPLTIAPVITTQPLSRTTILGNAVSFSVAASGTPVPTYQWQKDGAVIVGATNSSYAIASVGAGDAGTYTVIATNSAGAVTSNSAILTLDTIPAGFDVSAYLARYPDVAAIYGTDIYGAWLHYRDQGIYNGEIFDELFRVEEYLTLYPELAALFGTDLRGALLHWLSIGRIEGKLGRIPLEFSAAGYFTRNPDVATAVGGNTVLAWGHYWAYGIYEGRAYDDELRVFEYLAINADLTAAFVNDWRSAALHWMRYGRNEGRLGRLPLIFSAPEYLSRNPDVAAVWGTDPTTDFLHFWLYGINEGRVFDDFFRVDEYLTQNPDLAAIFGADRRGAFKHWVRYGRAEGRRGRNP